MNLQKLLRGLPIQTSSGPLNQNISALSIDSRKAKQGDAFICIKGKQFDAHTAVDDLYKKGVRVFFCEREVNLPPDASVIVLSDIRHSLGVLSKNFFEDPARDMTLIGITGSKGKTTVAHMIYAMLEAYGKKPGMIGTNGAWTKGKTFPLSFTTPDPIELFDILRDMKEEGCDVVVMEVSSFAMKFERVSALTFDLGLFLNIEEGDHVGPLEHDSYQEYYACKKAFLPMCKKTLIWSGEPALHDLKEGLKDCFTYGRQPFADYLLEKSAPVKIGTELGMQFTTEGVFQGQFCVHSLGEIGSLNALAALASIDMLGLDVHKAAPALHRLHITGRMEWIYRTDDYGVILDFAHNELSTRSVLQALRQYQPRRLICLFAVFGDRDTARRTGMGRAAGNYADLSIITEGHNRSETFESILSGILEGMHQTEGKYIVIEDRKKALEWAVAHREKGDILLILGLGNKDYLEQAGKHIPHDDRQIVLDLLKEAEPAEDF